MRAPQISCSFSGHRPEKLPWGDNERDERCLALKDAIRQMVEKAYADGYRHFICGMARGATPTSARRCCSCAAGCRISRWRPPFPA